MTVLESFLTGSYRRSTMIAPLKEADVDMVVVLDPKYYSVGGYTQLLDKVKAVLKKSYPKTPAISRSGQAVTVTFSDFKVDVVPAFNRRGEGYLIPNTELGRWIETDPKCHVEIWAKVNKVHDGDFVPLVKMIKGWNKSRDLFRSFHLEVLCLRILSEVRISSFSSAARYVFGEARGKIKYKLKDPAGYSDDVAAHVNTAAEMDKLIERLDWAYNTALSAERLAKAGDVRGAYEKWGRIFSGYFPAYG